MSGPTTIIIGAALTGSGVEGGIFQFTASLIGALGRLTDGDERYVIVGPHTGDGWLTPHLSGAMTLVRSPAPPPTDDRGRTRAERLKRMLGPFRRSVGSLYRAIPRPPPESPFLNAIPADLIHFPYQLFEPCNKPMVYNPHDLQHHHFPDFFAPGDLAFRTQVYRDGCLRAAAIGVTGGAVKGDVVRQYGVDPGKVFVIPVGLPRERTDDPDPAIVERTRLELDLPARFALYPAQTWQHKNHIRLLEAVASLRDRSGLTLPLVCTGGKNDFWPVVERRIADLGLEGQVRFPGYLPAAALDAVYHLADFVVYPSLFEGGSFPMLEAFRKGVPVASSDVTSLPEYGGDAVLFFDPLSVGSIAAAMRRMWVDQPLRETLRRRGSARVERYSWEDAARGYRAVYRHVARRELTDDDRRRLAVTSADVGG